MDDPEVYEIDLMKAAQIGWTYFLIGYLFKRFKDASTGRQLPAMMLFAKEKDGKAFHNEKLVEAWHANQEWIGDISDLSASKKSGNTWDYKKFVNGFLKLVGSNSPGNVKSTSSVGLGVVEEPDDTSDDVKKQGDSISNLEERLKRYDDSKLIVGGTPTTAGLSKTEFRVKASDARVLPITCHECGHGHVLDFDNVVWDGKNGPENVDADSGEILENKHEIYSYSKPSTARYVCPECGAEWDDYQRQENVRNTCFKAYYENGDKNGGWVATKPFFGKAGFMELSELYVCIPGTSLADVVREYLEAEHLAEMGDESKRIKFINQKKGKTYEYRSDGPDADALRERCEDYQEMVVPFGGYRLTAGVDLQHNRIAIKVKAWGKGEESWLVYAVEIYGDVKDKADGVWKELDSILFRPYKHEQGFELRIEAVTVDTSDGQTSAASYSYVTTRRRLYRGVEIMAGKGSSNDYGAREIFRRPSAIETKGRNHAKIDKYGLFSYQIGTHRAKDLIAGRLRLQGSGPGRMHWYKGVREDYFRQMTGEVKAPSRSGRKTWQQKAGQPVEFWDCEVYALHAAYAINIHRMTDVQWDEYVNKLQQADLFTEKQAAPVEQKRTTQAPRKGSYMNGWRK